METLIKLIINCFNTSLLLSSRISTNLAGNQPVTKIPQIIHVELTVKSKKKNYLSRWQQWELTQEQRKAQTSEAIELSNPTVFILLWDDLKKKD